MKKSLSLILAIAMVFSMFASVAFAAETTTTTTTTPKTALEKYEALKALGIFEGDENGANLEGDMERAQLAKIVAKLKGLTVDATANKYTDVAADHWAAGFIGAVTKAGIFDGKAAGIFDPEGNVTLEELAKVLVKVLGLTESTDAVTGVVSDWAKGYVAAAVKALGLSATDYTVNAIRGQFVELTYAANQLPTAGKVSLTEVKATGVKTVAVKFNKAVDTAVAKLDLKKGSIAITTTTVFADDKKSATITLTDVKLTEGTYSVTLSGIAADQIETGKSEFTTENEKISKLEFVSANDTLAKADKVIVKLKATNQYGENASTSAGNYTVYAGTNNDVYVKLAKAESGELLLTLDTDLDNAIGNATQLNRYIAGVSLIPVNIYHNDTRVTVSKNFKLGTAPFATKMEVSDVKYSNGKDSLSGMGEVASFDVFNYDQYGSVMPSTLQDRSNTRVILNAYEPAFAAPAIEDSNSDDVTDVKISLGSNLDKNGEYSYTVYNQAGNAAVKIAVKAGKVATKLELGEMADVIAAGDASAYIPLIAYDANGVQLTVDELVSVQNVTRIKLPTGITLETAGDKKGKLKVTNIPLIPKSVISVTASITEVNASSFISKVYNVSDVRIPDSVTVSTDPAKKAVAGANSAFKFIVKDQYGKELGTFKDVATNGTVDVTGASGSSKYQVSVTTTTYGDLYAQNNKVNLQVDGVTWNTGAFVPAIEYRAGDVGTQFNQEHKFVALSTMTSSAYAEVTAVIEKTTDNWAHKTEISNKVTKRIEAIKATDELTYTVSTVADLYNAIDTASVVQATYNTGADLLVTTQEDPLASKFRREVTVSAIDAAGNKVALPNKIKSVTPSNPQVARSNVIAGTTNGVATSQGFVIGNKKGTATLNVLFETHKGESLLQTVTVNVKDDIITSTKVAVGNSTRTKAQAVATPNAFLLMNVKTTDNYAITYEGLDAQKYNYLFGVVFTVKNIVGGGTVAVDSFGNLAFGGTVTSFELVATSAAGFSATTFVSN